jgi:hypothetical protein
MDSRDSMKNRMTLVVHVIDAINDQKMEMKVKVQRRAGPLKVRYYAGLTAFNTKFSGLLSKILLIS